MPLQPTSSFACGCPLSWGVRTIMAFHLVACLIYLVATFSNIVLHVGYFESISSWGPLWQFLMIGFNITGVTVILLGLWGTIKRVDVAVRLYLLYLLMTFVLDTVALLYFFLWDDSCASQSKSATASYITHTFGRAFMCGLTKIISYVFVSATICLEVYCLYVVWSFCEDVHEGVNGPALHELLPGKMEAFSKKHEHMFGEREGPYANISGLYYFSNKLPTAYPASFEPYGAFEGTHLTLSGGGAPHVHEHGPHGPTYFGY